MNPEPSPTEKPDDSSMAEVIFCARNVAEEVYEVTGSLDAARRGWSLGATVMLERNWRDAVRQGRIYDTLRETFPFTPRLV